MFQFFLVVLSLTSLAQYQAPYANFLDKDYRGFVELVRAQLDAKDELFTKRSLLKVVLANQSKFYNVEDFVGKVLPFHNGDCLKDLGRGNLCSSFRNFKFYLAKKKNTQLFEVRFKGKVLSSYESQSRTQLSSPDTVFGGALHLIYNRKDKSSAFLLVREIERAPSGGLPLRQTINVFKLKENGICRLLEADASLEKEYYSLIVEYVRVLGAGSKCKKEPIFL